MATKKPRQASLLDALDVFEGRKDTNLESLTKQLRKTIESSMEDYHNHDDRIFERRLGVIHPSQCGYECPRRLVYSIIGAVQHKNDKAQGVRIFQNGHSFHERQTLTLFRTMDRTDEIDAVMSNIKVGCDEWGIAGEIDDVVNYHGHWILMEHKSMKQERFKALTWPSNEYIAQVQAYFKCRPLDLPEMTAALQNLKEFWPQVAVVDYENKNDQAWEWFTIFPDEAIQTKLAAKFKVVWDSIKAKKFPERLCSGQTCQAAMWCPYAMSVCYEPKLTFKQVDRRHLQIKTDEGYRRRDNG